MRARFGILCNRTCVCICAFCGQSLIRNLCFTHLYPFIAQSNVVVIFLGTDFQQIVAVLFVLAGLDILNSLIYLLHFHLAWQFG